MARHDAPATPPPNIAAVAQEVKGKDEKARAVQFVQWLSNSEWQKSRALFDKAMVEGLSEKKTELIWTQLVAQHGAFQKITGTFEGEYKEYKIVWVNARFESNEMGLLDAPRADWRELRRLDLQGKKRCCFFSNLS